MRLGIPLNYAGDFRETVDNLMDFEAVGVDRITLPEGYSFDAVSQMGYIAARTHRMELAFGILPMYTRTPTTLAMTAAGIDYISGGRCVLGIGASGPQVIEGFHGVVYDSPVDRAREHVDICRKLWRREASEYRGRHYILPLSKEDGGSGLGKALKLINHPVRERIPMLLAAIGPKNVELAAEMFDEWQPHLFHPGHVDSAFGPALAAGTAKRDPSLPQLGIVVHVNALITEDEAAQQAAESTVRDYAALYVGGMGARGKNFYNALVSRYGFEEEAATIQDLYLQGRKAEAAAAVPEDLVRAISLIGPASEVQARLAALRTAGVTCVLAHSVAGTHRERVTQMEQLKDLFG
ncbi:LLM class F420-dependent oxidoreductase [Mycolicibacterium fortuitum]|uniref:LLM class F420-dependent oxidoreductase n=1 Tax=Mycolicibacterium fortuitum TaxID=1766 RepID=UPI0007ED12F4|nr:LLM class F420-dependent oxidoreductase [Mycolicibacterium fortuitum]OBI73193.1 LLM class F420-dependent oxidoreductase [Mycolicibacterium fortuitum]